MDDIEKIMPITAVKRNLLNIIKEMADDDATVTMTKNGAPVGVIMTPDRYEGLMETIEILSTPKILNDLSRSRSDFHKKKVHTHEEVWVD